MSNPSPGLSPRPQLPLSLQDYFADQFGRSRTNTFDGRKISRRRSLQFKRSRLPTGRHESDQRVPLDHDQVALRIEPILEPAHIYDSVGDLNLKPRRIGKLFVESNHCPLHEVELDIDDCALS